MNPKSAKPSLVAFWLVAIVLCATPSLRGETLPTLTDHGVTLNAGHMGQFELSYPALQTKDGALKLAETKRGDQRTVLTYEGGAQVVVTLADGGISLTYSHIPGSVIKIEMESLVDFTLSNGGSFQADARPPILYPVDKPAKPHLFQDHAGALTIKDVQGNTLAFTFPPYAYLEMMDNREWGWKTFMWKAAWPFNKDQPQQHIGVSIGGRPAGAAPVILVDQFGQNPKAQYPGKVTSVDELKADAHDEKAYYDSLKPPALDLFGGLPGSGAKLGLAKSGFFHTEKKGEKWFLVDSAGNVFYLLGICSISPCDDFTLIRGRESIYQWLPPDRDEFHTAYRDNSGSNDFSFHLANQIRKFGKPYDSEEYANRSVYRARKFGFNCAGPFSSMPKTAYKDASFPYIISLPMWTLKSIPDVNQAWDPFAPENPAALDKAFADNLPQLADDPLLVGYFLTNEPIFEDVPRVIPRLNGSYACKRKLATMLRDKYRTVEAFNTAWNLHLTSLDQLDATGLVVTTASAASDVQAFTTLFFETYYSLVANAFHKYDHHHLLVGNRFQAGTINNESLLRTAGKYMDVISFNYYTYSVDTSFLKRIYAWSGKPMMLTEYYYNSPKQSGLIGGGKDVATQEERGLGYRNYVETSASLDFVLGDEWFEMVDQSITGRFFSGFNGENGNTGLIAVTDRPWKDAIAQITKTNYDIYSVILGQRPAFTWNDPRFMVSAVATKALKFSRAVGEVKIDGTANGFPGTPAEQISSNRLVLGTEAGGVEAAFKICWDDARFYVLVNVTDPTPMQNAQTDGKIWNADAVELFIGPDQPQQSGATLFSDRHILLSAGMVDGKPHWHVENAPSQPEIQMFVVPNVNGKGYVLEAAIPFSALRFKPQSGKDIRFDIGIDDSADGKNRQRQLMWNGTDRNSGDRTGWGVATFSQ